MAEDELETDVWFIAGLRSVEHLTVECCSNQLVPGSIPGGRICVVIAQRHLGWRKTDSLVNRAATQAWIDAPPIEGSYPMHPHGPHRLVVRTSRRRRDNTGSTPGVDISVDPHCSVGRSPSRSALSRLLLSSKHPCQTPVASERSGAVVSMLGS